ncbi:antibiotic biosynthesis monooxygenase family protein [Alteromonas oceanisediminis]|uniref:antibiotic biosynthesis monooxygenase family protein n=1 Tax=Alteromonas oceanisediminis TaxID=2836180 RepID=UPI001BD9861D|nr:antibiotic biosynthesis monooxygenase [Alteromonas oceanisediminis]MBT0587408.1 antibiotic biosynthesis monooxygenase [Alteromonas oceanisediminis]
MATIIHDVYVQIIRFYLDNGNADSLARAIDVELQDWIANCPGFVSASLHISEDNKTVINYAQWQDKSAYDEFTRHSNQQQLSNTIDQFRPDLMESDPFTLVAQAHA